MDRLQKKCLTASALLHGFLFLLLVVGSAFVTSRQRPADLPAIRVVPQRLIDAALAGGGGNPRLAPSDAKQKGDTLTPQPPQAAPPTPEPPKPRVEPPAEPAPVKPVVKAENAPKASPTASKKPAASTRTPVPQPLKLTPVNRGPTPKPSVLENLKPVVRTEADRAREEAEAGARAAAEARNRLARALGGASRSLREGFKDGTAVEVPGPGGIAYANYAAFVREAYDNAWIVSPSLTDVDAVAVVRVIIRRDGRVVSATIQRRSGSNALDRSVQQALDRVKFVAPFPEGTTDDQREFIIDFNLKTKRGLG
ncbi:MAG TPA: TonB family protein [Methylomirabilota bacterium]|nr:TonB family protein [Methylomirabilota bacterium]